MILVYLAVFDLEGESSSKWRRCERMKYWSTTRAKTISVFSETTMVRDGVS